MHFSVGMGSPMTLADVQAEAKVVEQSGFDFLTLVDTPAAARDMHVMMTVAALATERVRIGHGTADPCSMHPSIIANAAASIDELSGGRAFIGLSVGNPYYKFRKPATRAQLRDAILFMRRFMAGEAAEFGGVTMASTWIRSPLPIYMAANGPKALELAGEVADGVMTLGSHPAHLAWARRQVAKGAERAGRDPRSIDLWARCMVCVADSKESARRETSAYPSTYSNLHQLLARNDPDIAELRNTLDAHRPGYVDDLVADSRRYAEVFDVARAEQLDAPHNKAVSQRLIDFYHLSGRPEDILERIDRLAENGVDTVSVTTYTLADRPAMLRTIGAEIIARRSRR